MNKIKMGQFLRQLRKEKGKSLEELTFEFDKANLTVSTNAISSWENGKTIPELDNLVFLAEYYEVSVDEIFDGYRYEDLDLNIKYNLQKFENHDELPPNYGYAEITEEGTIIRNTFKTLIHKYLKEDLSLFESKEIIFILKNFYIMDESMNYDDFLSFVRSLRKEKPTLEEKWWNVLQKITPITYLTLTFENISDEYFKDEFNIKRMNYLEDYEKDALLSMVQNNNAVNYKPNTSKQIDYYKEHFGVKYDVDEITKDTIRFLITHGAKLNKAFLGRTIGVGKEERTVDILTDAHNALERPLNVMIEQNGFIHFYYVENTLWNRFLVKFSPYEDLLTKYDISYKELFDMVMDEANKKLPDSFYIRIAKANNIDTNREIQYIKADVDLRNEHYGFEKDFEDFHNAEWFKNIEYKSALETLKKDFDNGITTHKAIYHKWIGGKNTSERLNFVEEVRKSLSYKEYKQSRLVEKTKELLKEMDNLSLAEIREKYFKVGGDINVL